MRLAPRLALTFGLLAVVSTAGVGLSVRQRLAAKETSRFQREVASICDRVVDELRRQGDADQLLIGSACQDGELVDRVGIAIDRAELAERRTGFSSIVPAERRAFGLDELLVATDAGDIVGASPTSLLGLPRQDVRALVRTNHERFELRTGDAPAIVSQCIKRTDGGKTVGMVGARHVDPLLDRLAKTVDVTVQPSWASSVLSPRATTGDAPPPSAELARATCRLADDGQHALTFDVLKSTRELQENLADVDRTVGLYAAISGLVAFIAAVFLARSLGRPLADLAKEAGKVAAGEARPLGVRGSGEVQELAEAFDRMIQDLAVTRQRLAVASRIAAWREVARRVAHEVKNPLAPIRAAVETLRRLRARDDDRFDEYFDEATRTVLGEVHRISNIVTEFTRFARLPEPRLGDVDVEELARHVVQLHKAAAGETAFAYVAQRRAPVLRADRDQLVQVLTNLVQNAFDAVAKVPGGAVTLTTDTTGGYVSFTVTDNGVGVAPEMQSRLFEPYATNKEAGTGLGLAIAQRIAIEHGGELSFVGPSASGKGAVFRLLVPVTGPTATSDVASHEA